MPLRLTNPAARLAVLAIAVPPAAAALASNRQLRFGLRLTSGKDLHHVHACVLRNFSRGLGTRIQSIAWIDDISFSLGTPNP